MVAAAAVALAPPAVAQDAEDLRQLIELQRQQLETQQQQLEAMERRLEELEQDSFREEFLQGIEPPTPPVIAEGARVTSGETGIDLAISGQVNRMVTLADDGDKTKLYNVDNDNSSSRIRFVGRGRTDGGLVVGSLIEAQLQPNDSETVNRRNQDTGNVSFESRHVDLFVQHEEFGKVSLGRGDTASNNTAEVDLSGTTVIAYSSISDTAGGLLFYDDDTDALSDTQINDAYSNLDGLSRRDRLRYDTPTLAGFTLSADVISSARYSAGLTWAGQLPDWQMAAAAGYSYPGGGSDYIIDGSASVLHLPTGLNATVSAGQEARDDRDDASNVYVKLGWKRAFFSFGETAMSIDYAHNTDLDQDGDAFDTVGLFAVQAIEDFGVEFYGGYRFHSLDRDDADFDDIHTVSIGSRIKF
jgi:hypothetical protein